MPIESFFDLAISPVDLQRTAADTSTAQFATRRAVAPAVSLRGAFQAALERQQQSQVLTRGERRLALGARELGLGDRRLGIDQRRLGLREQQAGHEARQLPFEIGTGLVSGATRFYGGYRALEQQKQNEAFQSEYLRRLTEQGREGTARHVSLLEAVERLRRANEGQGYLSPQRSFERYGP